MNSSGKYFAFKEQLKHSVVKIVREKFLRTTGFTDKNELQVCFNLIFNPFFTEHAALSFKLRFQREFLFYNFCDHHRRLIKLLEMQFFFLKFMFFT